LNKKNPSGKSGGFFCVVDTLMFYLLQEMILYFTASTDASHACIKVTRASLRSKGFMIYKYANIEELFTNNQYINITGLD
jgi:hypothetical protein